MGSADLGDDRGADTPNKDTKTKSFYNARNAQESESNIFDPAFDFNVPSREKRISSIVKLVHARDPPNKFFESTVNLANQDAWKRRSIYMSKANMGFEAPREQKERHTVMSPFETPNLTREDSADDDSWNNTDE